VDRIAPGQGNTLDRVRRTYLISKMNEYLEFGRSMGVITRCYRRRWRLSVSDNFPEQKKVESESRNAHYASTGRTQMISFVAL
jgi:hypothetical protein